MRLIHFALALAALGLGTSLRAQDAARTKSAPIRRGQPSDPLPLKYTGPRTVAAITRGDLMTRLYKFADDSMMGRLAGTPWNDKGTDYIAAEVRRLGLTPGGDSGTYFQHPLITREVAATSTLGVAGTSYELWKDFAPRDQGPGSRSFDGVTTVYGGVFGDTSTYLSAADAEGKVVVVRTGSDSTGAPDVNVINRFLLTQRYASAAAIAVIFLDWAPPGYVDESFRRPQVDEKREEAANPAQVPSYFYITRAIARDLFGSNPDSLRTGMTGRAVSGATHIETKQAPGRNVIAILPGSDPALRGQYVVIGAHNDHIGFNHRPVDHDSVKAFLRVAAPQGADNAAPNPGPEDWARINAVKDSLRRLYAERPDSIYNGADDDGSGSMTVLEIAEAFAGNRARPRRSIMFVWHVGEELGLLGSEYFTDHPTVARDSMVAELNIDMVGRGHRRDVTGSTKGGAVLHGGPSYLQLVGARRLSTELGDLVERVNATQKPGLTLDYAMDANGHPQNIYCRSDHYEYARYGIPIVFFTTGGHADYHQVTDEPQYIEYGNMARVAKLVHAAARRVGNLNHRVVVDHDRPDPHGNCKQ